MSTPARAEALRQEIDAIFREERSRAHALALQVRWCLALVIAVVSGLVAVLNRSVVGVCGLAFAVILALGNALLAGRSVGSDVPWRRRVAALFEIGLLAAYQALDAGVEGAGTLDRSAALLLYPLLLLLYGLQLDRGLLRIALLAELGAWNAVYFGMHGWLGESLRQGEVLDQLFRDAFLVLAGVILLSVPGLAERLLRKQAELHERGREHFRLAHLDALTGLPNRRSLQDALAGAISESLHEGRVFVVAYLDLDGFKPVNDTLGHAEGDRLLQEVARRLQAGLRTQDLVARLGGDEFALVLRSLDSPEAAEAVVLRLLAAVADPSGSALPGLALGMSAGLAAFPDHAGTPEELLRRADQALYRVKHARKGGFAWAEEAPPPRSDPP